MDDDKLRFGELNAFDEAMVHLLQNEKVLQKQAENRWMHQDDKMLIYNKGNVVFIFNFHPENPLMDISFQCRRKENMR